MDHQVENKRKKDVYVLLMVLLLFVIAISIVINPEFIDYYYMKATGDYLLKGGSFNVNPFTVNDLGIITQQWLYCIWISIVDKGGPVLIFCVVCLYLSIYFVIMHLYTKNHKLDVYKAFTIFAITIVASGGYFIRIRPETISIMLLLLQIFLMEKAYMSGKKAYLYGLPLIMLVEINIHGSVWFTHYLLILAYTFPNVLKKFAIDNQLNKKEIRGHLLISSLLMAGVMFINPYGYKMITYTFMTLKNDVFSYIIIAETQKPYALSFMAFIVYALIALVVFGVSRKALRISSVYLALGFSLMSLMMSRNLMFATLGFTVVLTDILKFIFVTNKKTIDFKIKKMDLILVKVVVFLFAAIFAFVFFDEIVVKKWDTKFSFTKIADYVDENYEKDDPIYAVTQVGSYFEYRGYNKIYTDSRPEIYIKDINGKKDVLKEYDMFGQGLSNNDMESISPEKVEEFIENYGFKCLIVGKYEKTLYYYLSVSDEYEVRISEKGEYLFEKIK